MKAHVTCFFSSCGHQKIRSGLCGLHPISLDGTALEVPLPLYTSGPDNLSWRHMPETPGCQMASTPPSGGTMVRRRTPGLALGWQSPCRPIAGHTGLHPCAPRHSCAAGRDRGPWRGHTEDPSLADPSRDPRPARHDGVPWALRGSAPSPRATRYRRLRASTHRLSTYEQQAGPSAASEALIIPQALARHKHILDIQEKHAAGTGSLSQS